MKIAMTSVYVNDTQKAFRFYTEVLGFASRMHIPEANLAIVVSSDDPSGTGLLLEPNEHPVAKAYQEGLYTTGLPVITFGVDDIGKEYERLTGLGVVFRKTPAPTEWGMEAIFDDTCGNYIQLAQVTK